MVIRLRPEHEEAYRVSHAAVPEGVLRTIHACNIRNYSIFLRNSVLYGYFEYIGSDYAADMAKMAADPATQDWWAIMEPMQEPYPDRDHGTWWALMDEVFHTD
ncbi:L-rhamnose mutarotase [Acidipila sp. 4G-K13]|nr:L-rhamnose mutarotase [Paracidobacterium acidisoli]